MEVEAEPGWAEGCLGLLTAALQELRAAMTDPAQYDGEDGQWAGLELCAAKDGAKWLVHSLRVVVAGTYSCGLVFGNEA